VSTATGVLPLELSRFAGVDLGAYRADHVAERVRRAVERERTEGVEGLVRALRADRGARSRFRRSLAISVSGLFRDAEQFELLERELLPPLLAGRRRLRVWSAGCADGSELYSVALLLDRAGGLERSFLLGSDLLEENLAVAKAGVSRDFAAGDRLRSYLRWERRDIARDGPPAGSWRLILCRNVAIYFAPDAKRDLHAALARALAPSGVLLLGRSERVADPAAVGLRRVARNAYAKEAVA
jgi:chemotaxis protein methyltransferase CheR